MQPEPREHPAPARPGGTAGGAARPSASSGSPSGPPSATARPDEPLAFGPWRARVAPARGLGVVLEGLVHAEGLAAPADYVDGVLLTDAHREAFLALVDRAGLVVCKGVEADGAAHRDVRGRSSRGRLSQAEYYHHDGCSGPRKPRVVEIRCPHQALERHTRTAIAPFADVVVGMLLALPLRLRQAGELAAWHARAAAGAPLPVAQWDHAQGAVNRAVRRGLDAEEARAYFRAVDERVAAYREPWAHGESRFIANASPAGPDAVAATMQHRRAYQEPHAGGRPNGHLVKRWPADPDLEALHDGEGGDDGEDGAPAGVGDRCAWRATPAGVSY